MHDRRHRRLAAEVGQSSHAPVVCIQRVKFGAAPRGAVGPALASGLALAARPPHVGPPGLAPILLTRLLTTDLDEHEQRWNCQVAA